MKKLAFYRSHILLVLAFLCFGLMTAEAEASIIDYQFSGSGVHGNLNAEAIFFENANFTIDIVGDTLNVDLTDPVGPIIYTGLTATMSLYGGDLGVNAFFNAPITDTPLYVAITTDTNLISFGTGDPYVDGFDQLSFIILSLISSGYDLTTNTAGPYNASAILPSLGLGLGNAFADVAFDTVNSGTFQAVPVPAPVLLLASGLVGFVVMRRRANK